MDDLNTRISISASYNRAADVLARRDLRSSLSMQEVANAIDELARAIYAKEQAFYREVTNQSGMSMRDITHPPIPAQSIPAKNNTLETRKEIKLKKDTEAFQENSNFGE